MSKKYNIGDKVIVTFITRDYECILTKFDDEDKGTFWAKTTDGIHIPAIGIDGSEKWANIFTDKQK